MRIVLLGCPGAGKGTQAKIIAEKYHIPAISTGDIFRAAIQQKNALGEKIKTIVDNGFLVPDDIVIQLIQDRLTQSDCTQGFLLDGFPRTVMQAQALQQLSAIDYVIDIDVPEEEVIKRLSGRRVHPASGRVYHLDFHPPKQAGLDDVTGEPLVQRPDDSEETIRKRLAVYHAETSPLQHYYQQLQQLGVASPRYIKVMGTGDVKEITAAIMSSLNESL